MATRNTIVIGASAGGVQALSEFVKDLPSDLPAAVFIVLHIPTDAPSLLPAILAQKSNLPVAHATDGEPVMQGRIYVAPPDRHLLIEGQRVRLVHGPKENLHRPSIDALFRSAARWLGPRVIGVILTGSRNDGRVGMRAVKQRGGLTVVQDPMEASYPSMPTNVMQEIKVDYSIPLREIAPLLTRLSHQQAEEEGKYPVPYQLEIETRIAQQEMEGDELIASVDRIGRISKLTCPDCHGALWEIDDDEILRYRCHVGHAYSAEALDNGQSQMLEVALWSAIRALEEQAVLARRIQERARKANQMHVVSAFERRAQEAEEHSSAIRRLLLNEVGDETAEPALQGDD